ncbi:MAG: hypothetical protein HYY06_19130, partial [Deltaproteobacteria bacterium]|nr:hypothetical protein [Deltaproteobacteria bacterium]
MKHEHLEGLLAVAMFATVAGATLDAGAWDGSQNLEPGLDPGAILLFEDFESADFGSSWPTYWGAPPGPDTVSDPVWAGSRALIINSFAGEHYSDGGGEYAPFTGAGEGVDEIYMRLYIFLEDGYSLGTCNQLKLFAIKGGASIDQTYGGAGVVPTGYDKMAVVLAIDNDWALHFYTYHMDQASVWGDYQYLSTAGQAYLEAGRWVELEVGVKLNTPGQADGVIRGWVDGVLRGEVRGLRFRLVNDVKIRRLDIEQYWGGGGPENTSPVNQSAFIDNVVVSNLPVGSSSGDGGGGDTGGTDAGTGGDTGGTD